MGKFPNIVVLSHSKDKAQIFIKYLLTKFEVIDHYSDEQWNKVLCGNKETDDNLKDFIFKKEAKIQIVNKYYQAQVIILSCIPYTLESEKQNEDTIKDQIVNNNLFSDNNKYQNLNLNCESIIFLFEEFNEDTKKIINNNPFINFEEKCNEYIKDTKSGKIIKNYDFDFSNLYKDIGVKIAIFPLLLQKKEREILKFCTEYFIECLYIEYESNNSDKPSLNGNNKIMNQTQNKIKNFNEFDDDDAERLIEALHCHMWKGLQLKKEKIIIPKDIKMENNTNTPYSENTKKIDESQDISLSKEKSLILKNNEQKEDSKNSEEKLEKKVNQKKSNEPEKINNSDTHNRKDDKFMENFNQIVEKIKLAKIENQKCNNDSERRKKAENIVLELQQYFYGMDEE
ncbi:conserved Plasmodium protein, unknown function [Plasmodium berghei]|uniref:Uncharacterized protein n=2 Tax=Plasmodium berghei TaxID=5821 RepID=A0A509AR11_PLABA|nr:conserved Plasmodium protein, unknown function [Plasmodium berghei ANKA]CXI82636.1 conserved Plasmodium protein, unknown function [Plasmodium berghei]SCM25644.1 conserved Plasmodium protein, unknown function [Plasmodium berghei]SCN27433.1 conserved Plasmodium protein, unknown function [Plasmodium berghei]SCO62125.1 conserved Plasmodium protein, unknown function [Plasmodium berghei]SCO63860.1 conserved Plasmodium protein, unknown function [Plasmodium berghei]|eukprot:XP_034423065.1 conserved Plasmodium protein, unknown function [Plasmodium berghei ANKA]